MICIVCHQDLRHLSEQGTSSMGTHMLAKVHILTITELTQSEIALLTRIFVDEAALAIWKRQGSREITIVSLPKTFIFGI